jgi:thiaminase/transcriptional activator TenA
MSKEEQFTAHLRKLADPIWQAQHEHAFLRGVGDGTLEIEQFKHWLRQDYLFLIDYARVLLFAAARSPDLTTMTRFAELASATLQTEMELHRSYANEFGISREELEVETKAPTAQAYTDFLLRTAAADDFPVLVAALLPCFWGLSEIGQRLAERGRPADSRYANWIGMYASAEFTELAQWCRDLLDRLASSLSEAHLRRLEEAFVLSSRYECLFWEMAYRQERWPL